MDLEGVAEEVNEKHMDPWAKMCQSDGVENTPISPYIAAETLLNKPLCLDGSKLAQTGFTLAYPKLTTEIMTEVNATLFFLSTPNTVQCS
jgi:hypothetical protein